jgi:hypothetical protein
VLFAVDDLREAAASGIAGLGAGEIGDVVGRPRRLFPREGELHHEFAQAYLLVGIDIRDVLDDQVRAPDIQLVSLLDQLPEIRTTIDQLP